MTNGMIYGLYFVMGNVIVSTTNSCCSPTGTESCVPILITVETNERSQMLYGCCAHTMALRVTWVLKMTLAGGKFKL